jgi:hypothetical protein
MLETTNPDGSANVPAALKRIARHPSDIAKFTKLGRDMQTAAKAAAETFLSVYR